jgi:lipopolysaccharide export system permease protein
MRKLDQLIIKAFIGPFVLTTAVSTFILLIQHMLKYFDDFVGKDLGIWVFAKLLFYFSLNMLQIALPLGVLVSSLMTFGNLGENFELTAIKSSGISLVRALRLVFVFVFFVSIGAYYFNNYILPTANLKAYSLLYDIKNKKPTLDISEGVFYQGIPNYTIKVNKKLPDDVTLLDVKIWDHNAGVGNRRVIVADSSRMFTFMNERYLKLELYRGQSYSESRKSGSPVDQLSRTAFDRMDLVFSLASFEFDPTDPSLFTNNRQMMDVEDLTIAIDSMEVRKDSLLDEVAPKTERFFRYHSKPVYLGDISVGPAEPRPIPPVYIDTTTRADSLRIPLAQDTVNKEPTGTIEREGSATPYYAIDEGQVAPDILKANAIRLDSLELSDLDSILTQRGTRKERVYRFALSQARNIKNHLNSSHVRLRRTQRELNKYTMEKYKKYSQALACIVMFLIGAPLGAIIKKGGLGVPVIISVFFFILYYVLNMMSHENAEESKINPILAVWVANIVLLPIGIFFLRQARIDARLFDSDIYVIWWDKNVLPLFKRKKLVKK